MRRSSTCWARRDRSWPAPDTKTDGVVDWRCCINEFGDGTDIEVPGTHVGLAFNPQVYRHLGHFLAEPETYRQDDAG